MRAWSSALLFVLALPFVAAGCGDDDTAAGDDQTQITAAATTTHVADLVRNVGGDRVQVEALIPAGADPHAYEPRPSDAAAIAEAPVVFKSGGDLDSWLDDLLANAGADTETVTLIDSVETIEGGHHHEEDEHAEDEHAEDEHAEEEHAEEKHAEEEGHAQDEEHAGEEIDPHWWHDPRNAVIAVATIRDALIAADPEGRATYERNAAAYSEQLERLDSEIARCMEQVPTAQRKLVTTHDALGYFADRYDVEVVGAIIPSLSTQAQPSAKDISTLSDQIESEQVNAIFPETALNDRLEQAISRETGATVGEALWADSLGPEGSTGETYLDAMAFNTEAMVDGMSAGKIDCRPQVD